MVPVQGIADRSVPYISNVLTLNYVTRAVFSNSLKSEEPLKIFEISLGLSYTTFFEWPFSFELYYSLKRILNVASEIIPNEYDLL